jgi:hypothetical protein
MMFWAGMPVPKDRFGSIEACQASAMRGFAAFVSLSSPDKRDGVE